MGKIEILSPIHIGNGETYYSSCIHQNHRYAFEDILQKAKSINRILNKDVLNELSNTSRASQLSNRQFFELLGIDTIDYKEIKPLYGVDYFENKPGKVQEIVCDANQLFIPGSSIKGYLNSLIWYDIILKSSDVKNFILEALKSVKKDNIGGNRFNFKFSNIIEEKVKYVYQLFGCTDIYLDNKHPFIYECSRERSPSKKNPKPTPIPVGLVECINSGIIIDDCEIIFNPVPKEIMEKRYKALKGKYLKNEDRDYFIKSKISDEYYQRILDFKKWIIDTNKKLMNKSIEREMAFLERTKVENTSINYQKIHQFYVNIKERLDKGEFIFRIGKFTNYLVKSIGTSFGIDFDQYFDSIFNPDKNKKHIPNITSMNLLKDEEGTYSIVPGFIKVDL